MFWASELGGGQMKVRLECTMRGELGEEGMEYGSHS